MSRGKNEYVTPVGGGKSVWTAMTKCPVKKKQWQHWIYANRFLDRSIALLFE